MKRSHARGFSLVEVLVSIVVLAIGVIGAAGMQLTALRTSQYSGQHSSALELAAELADRMRSNDEQMRQADEGNVFLGLNYEAADGAPAAPSADCFANACNSHELAEFDLYEWLQQLRSRLPGAHVVVCRDSVPWDDAGKRLDWDCDESETASLVIKIGWAAKDPGGELTETVEGASAPQIALLVAPYVP